MAEGPALRVAERGTLERLAELWMAKIGWPYDVVEDGFRHHPEGPQPETSEAPGAVVPVFAVRPVKILAFGRGEAFSQTRFRP
ncbi:MULTISPECIES: hypothetical protein [unclassified Streptomyces]|uniref:hypothetical protein n=1 Tax=unclassified Streptomyces TaxID=2593676 RepID=UPI001F544D49|nr:MULTISPECIES: hypothetical protein [unclassified Streptomyces]